MSFDPRQELPSGRYTRRTVIDKWVQDQLSQALFLDEDVEGPDNPKLFEFVGFGTLEDIPPRMTPAAMIQDGEEEKIGGVFEKTTKLARVYIHLKVIKVEGVDQQDLINYYFGRVVQTLVKPEDFAGYTAMDVGEVGNAIIANGQTDPEPGGTIWFDVEYRYTLGNPFAE